VSKSYLLAKLNEASHMRVKVFDISVRDIKYHSVAEQRPAKISSALV